MIVQFAKSFKDYAMAVVKYNDRIFVIPWDEIRKRCIFDEENLSHITYCIHKEYITFVLVCDMTSFVIVYNADSGVFDYVLEGKCIVKATYCGDTVYAIAKIPDDDIINVYKCQSKASSNVWEYESTGLKKKNNDNDQSDYKLIAGKESAYIKLDNPLNEVEYTTHINDNYSIYCLYDYWKDKNVSAFEGEINKNSLFFEFQFGEPLTTASITHCNDVKFAVGYLKYVVLGDVAYMLLNSENERNPVLMKNDKELENDYIPDVEYMLDFCIRNTKDKNSPVTLLEEMVELCDDIFLEKDNSKALEMFIDACELCNRYLGEEIFLKLGFRYAINVYAGIGELKDRLSVKYENKKEMEKIYNKKSWDFHDRIMIKNFLNQTKAMEDID